MNSSETIFRATTLQLEPAFGKQEAQSLSFLLLEHLYSLTRTEILSGKEIDDDKKRDTLKAYITRLNQSEPLQYILGRTEFYGLPFDVNPSVLIPRPETEELVHLILSEHKNTNPLSILDIGTGSGCIAISLKKNLPHALVTALDVSEAALRTAKKNAVLNQAEIDFIQKDILTSTTEIPKTSIIVSNPPYVTNAEKVLMHENVLGHEPSLALFVEDHDPLIFYRTITEKAREFLLPNGKLYFEINEQFGKETAALLMAAGFVNVKIMKDLHDKDRMVCGKKNVMV